MKLLLDQNISRKILSQIARRFPESSHVYWLNLHKANDFEIWEFAKKNNYTIVSKDSDFLELSLLYGIPPKFIWVRCDNGNNQFLSQLLIKHADDIERFLTDDKSFCLEIY